MSMTQVWMVCILSMMVLFIILSFVWGRQADKRKEDESIEGKEE